MRTATMNNFHVTKSKKTKPTMMPSKYPNTYLHRLIVKSVKYLDEFERIYPQEYPEHKYNLLPVYAQQFIKLLLHLHLAGKKTTPLSRDQLCLLTGYKSRSRFLAILSFLELALINSDWCLMRQPSVHDNKTATYYVYKRLNILTKSS